MSGKGEEFLDDDLRGLFGAGDDPLAEALAAPKDAARVAAVLAQPAPAAHVEPCRKCGGSGQFRGYSGRIIGACFTCKGTGRQTFKNDRATRANNRANVAARKERKAAENLEAFKAANPAVWAWLDGNPFAFAVAMREALAKWGALTDNQLAACERCILKRDAGRKAAEERKAEAKPVSTAKLEACFAKAGASLRAPRLRLAGLTIKPAKATSANAGALYVQGLAADKSENVYLGKIAGGKFYRSRDCSAEQEAKVLAACDDPLGAAVAYGRLTGACACCGRELTNSESIARGIGPICAEQWGM